MFAFLVLFLFFSASNGFWFPWMSDDLSTNLDNLQPCNASIVPDFTSFYEFQILPFCGDLYIYGNAAYTGSLLVTDEGVIVVDATARLVEDLIDQLEQITDLPIVSVIYSHAHADHIGGAGYIDRSYDNEIEFIGSKNCQDTLIHSLFLDIDRTPLPTKVISTKKLRSTQGYTYTLGGKSIIFLAPYTPHSSSDMWVLYPDQKVLQISDVSIFPVTTPNFGFQITHEIEEYIQTMEYLLEMDEWEYIMGGHGRTLGTKKDIEIAYNYTAAVRNYALYGFSIANFQDAINEVGSFTIDNRYEVLNVYFEDVIDGCYQAIINDDTFSDLVAVTRASSLYNCERMVMYLFSDSDHFSFNQIDY